MLDKHQKGDLLWQANNLTGEVRPVVFVRNVKNGKAVVDGINEEGELKRAGVTIQDLVMPSVDLKSVNFKSKELKKQCAKAVQFCQSKRLPQVSLEKCQVSDLKIAKVVLEKVVIPDEIKEDTTEISIQKTPEVRRKKPRRSQKNAKEVQDEESEEEELNDDVLDKIEESRKDFLNDLDDSDDEGHLDENSNKENENDKENDDDWTPAPKPALSWKPVIGGGIKRKPLSQMVPIKSAIQEPPEEMPDYEKERLANIAEQRALFMAKLKEAADDLYGSTKPKPVKRVQKSAEFRRKKVVRKIYSTRRSSRANSENSTPLDSPIKGEEESEYESDDEFIELPAKKRRSNPSRWTFNPNEDIKMPEDISNSSLSRVADYVSSKIYSQSGTTCHQCRQKTTDFKTICRSGRCQGSRGFFCGVCLKNRYGQDARVALKDPTWWCPPCKYRNILTRVVLSKQKKQVIVQKMLMKLSSMESPFLFRKN